MTPQKLQQIVWKHYTQNGRTHLPWRKKSATPYEILVSEVMLQQTQVDRVIPKFKTFIRAFPSFKTLAHARQSDVLKLWQGLGYNRRALNLKKTAEIISTKHSGRLPHDDDVLRTLPGIGPYIAGAVRAFAFNIPSVFIETNIRTVFLHHYFAGKTDVDDRDILPLIEKTLDHDNPKDWYAALMDYGAHLKRVHTNPSRGSKHHTTQSRFEGSRRQKRGIILKLLTETERQSTSEITKHLGEPSLPIIKQLEREGFVVRTENGWELLS